jgi:hypothetical protein
MFNGDFVKPLIHNLLPQFLEIITVILTSAHHYNYMEDYMKNGNTSS